VNVEGEPYIKNKNIFGSAGRGQKVPPLLRKPKIRALEN
jgi:hypothetical protein